MGLSFLHAPPADEAVEVIDQEHNKADDDGNVGDILQGGQRPQHNQHNIVGGVSQRKVRAAAEGQIHRNEAGGDGQRAGHHVGGVQIMQNVVKQNGYCSGQKKHQSHFIPAQAVHSNLRFVSFVGVAQPGNEGEYRHGSGHAQVCNHLTVVAEAKGKDAVQNAENHHQKLSEGIALGVED